MAGILALLAACSSLEAVATPADAQGIFEELARRGGTVTEIVSGETGCGEADLVDNAIRFRLLAPGAAEPARVHLFLFRGRAAFDQGAEPVERCRSTFESGAPAGSVGGLAVAPYRLFASGWSPEAGELLETTLEAMAGDPR